MARKWLAVLMVWLLVALSCTAEEPVPKDEKDKASYSIGVEMARNLKKQEIEVDANLLLKGMKDEFEGKKLLLDEKELKKTVTNVQAAMRRKQAVSQRMAAMDNKKEGEAFLEENKTKEGVLTLPSGLQYKILKAGEGKKPTAEETVEVNYRGTLINGTEFDSSYGRGQPATFKVSGVIPGWREALQPMPVGSKWQLFIHPRLAYGERGMGQAIGPNATLIFEVELLAIK